MPIEQDALQARLKPHGQEHVLRWWPELTDEQRASLATQIEALNLPQLDELWRQVTSGSTASQAQSEALQPAPVQRLPESIEDWERAQQAAAVGEAALKAGQVGVLLVAGGQGTRLGHPGPKGTYPIGPVSQRTLFQIHAEKLLALGRRYETPLPLCLMTSPENDAETRQFFAKHDSFGLETDQVHYFVQGTMPAIDASTGKLLLTRKDQLALSPNGHGGIVEALASCGLLGKLQDRGVKQLFYFQVDNPLVKIADPVYLGQHLQAKAEMSIKVLPKLNAEEPLGVVVQVGDQRRLVEYSNLSSELANRTGPDGELELWAGSIAIHLFDCAFLDRLARSEALPFHRALKVVPVVDEHGQQVKPELPNAIKFERFVFDALPLAENALIVETNRREEFEPLKNATGMNSPGTVRQALSDLYADWLRAAGVEVPCSATGSSIHPIEISPLFALDAEELRGKALELDAVTGPLLLE